MLIIELYTHYQLLQEVRNFFSNSVRIMKETKFSKSEVKELIELNVCFNQLQHHRHDHCYQRSLRGWSNAGACFSNGPQC